MPAQFAPQAPGAAGRALFPTEIAAILEQARIVDGLIRRITQDVALGVRLMLEAAAINRLPRFSR